MVKLARSLTAFLLCLCLFAPALAEDFSVTDVTDEVAQKAAALTPEEEALMDELAASLEDDPTTEVDLTNLEVNPDLPDYVFNILLIGVDSRNMNTFEGRSDALIICSVNRMSGAVTLTSIARDLAVDTPGYETPHRINTAYRYAQLHHGDAAGAEMAMKTVNRNFKMNIEHYVLINIHGLAAIIESLGGVDMYMTGDEAQEINYQLFEDEPMDDNKGRDRLKLTDGVQHLDGMQAVTYGRIRNLSGQNDINRNSRQRHLLEVLLQKVMQDMDLMKLLQLVQTALPYGRTNLSTSELVELGLAVLSGEPMDSLQAGGEIIHQFAIPMEGQYGYKTFGEQTLLYISKKRMETTLTALHETIYGH